MRQALGKGLDALLNGSNIEGSQDNGSNTRIQRIPLDKIIPNRFQPRKTFNEESLQELAQSLKQHGLTQPIVVIYDGGLDKYEIVVGERRYRAAKIAGFTEIDCVVHTKLDDKQMCALALIENIQREDLNPIETALGYKSLIQKFMVSQTELGEYCGKSKAAVSNSLRLLNLEENIQDALRNGVISEGHGRALLMLPSGAKRDALFNKIISSKISVRQAEAAAQNALEDKPVKTNKKDADIVAFEQNLQEALGTKVELKTSGKSGKKGILLIHYDNLEQLDSIAEKLKSKLL
ncbi:MAG: ParB/RepB/Spo0J family partition protein [Elusimicrobiaceae bacterium]|nr:ParB/RepB/Spo0J family partition protein [Elusimicrobiaceae bacterium]